MLNPPPGFPEVELRAELLSGWRLAVTRSSYRPVGFGSHHWLADTEDGRRWFVTVDDLPARRDRPDEPLTEVRDRLERALGVAWSLGNRGRRFLVAPIRGAGPHLLRPFGERYAVSLYEFVDGDGFPWIPDGWRARSIGAAHRAAALDIVRRLHQEPRPLPVAPDVEDFALPQRDLLVTILDEGGAMPDAGPYAKRAGVLLAEYGGALRRVLVRYDALAAAGRSRREDFTLTHGEPHPGNTMFTAEGYVLIDWDTALIAPPERDLWHFGLGDPEMVELYRTRWPLTDVALAAARFHGPHQESANDRTTWNALIGSLADLDAGAA